MNEDQLAGSEVQPSQGMCIEIACLPDGTFNVSMEPLQQEMGEEQPGEGAGTPASDIKEALTAALELYKQMGSAQGDDDFAQGFGKAAPAGAPPVERGMVE